MLDIDAGEVQVEPASPGEDLRVTLRYTKKDFRERVIFDEKNGRLKVQLDGMRWRKWHSYDSDADSRAEVTVRLPLDVDIYLSSEISAGDIRMDLGGLRLREFSFRNFAGEVEIRFDKPNPVVMELLEVDTKVGSGLYLGLGNARFKRADINAGIGEIEVDFTGNMEPGAQAKVDLDIGEARVVLSGDAPVRVRVGGGLGFLSNKDIDSGLRRRGGDYINDRYRDGEAAFRIRITPGLGELSVILE